MIVKLSNVRKKKNCNLECERCPFDSTFSKYHWMSVGYYCRIDDYEQGIEEDREVELLTKEELDDCSDDILSLEELLEVIEVSKDE